MQKELFDQINRFLDWASKKVKIHFSDRGELYFEEREIWWASLGENIGSETNGKNFHFERPIIVLKKFSSDMLLAVPATTKLKNGSWFHRFSFDGQDRRAVMSQLRTISSRRLIRKMGNMSTGEFVGLREAVIGLIKTDPPTGVGGSSDPLSRTM